MTFEPITKTEARGDSPALPREALDAFARRGETILARRNITAPSLPADAIADAWKELQTPWGGATINVARGEVVTWLHSGYAVSIGESVTLPIDASETELASAIAKVATDTNHVGVFRDEDLQRIDVDAVFIARDAFDAYAVGVARHATGGAYNFATGNALWIPHLASDAE